MKANEPNTRVFLRTAKASTRNRRAMPARSAATSTKAGFMRQTPIA